MLRLRTISALLGASSLFSQCAFPQDPVVLHNFSYPSSVSQPDTTLVEVSPGVFVGSYATGLFEITSTRKFGIFSSFEDSPYDIAEEGALTPASNGYLYGVQSATTYASAVYRISPSGAAHSVVNASLIGASPLTEASDGNLWGTQGSENGPFSVFKLSLSGETLTTVAVGLAGPTYGPLLQASDGDFYGSTGIYTPGGGQVYRVMPSGEIAVLHTFPDGEGSLGGLIEGSNGLFYGTTFTTEPACSSSGGQIFAMSLSGSFKTLYQFVAYCGGNGPEAGLLEASDGNLYGTTDAGGEIDYGSIFRISLDGSNYSELISFNFNDGAGLGTQGRALTQGSDGKLYGTAGSGGSEGGGVVFQLDAFLPPPLPRIGLNQPEAAKPGTTIRLTGNYLLGLSGVSFNGTPAEFTAVNVNYAYAVVPAGATTGPIMVTTPNGSYTTKSVFTVE